LTLAVKRAAEKGIPYYQVGWRKDTTSRFASQRITPPRGEEKEFFRHWLRPAREGGGTPEFNEMSEHIQKALSPLFIIGPGIADITDGSEIPAILQALAGEVGADMVVPNPYGNLWGLVAEVEVMPRDNIQRRIEAGEIDLLYLIGDAPFQERPPVKFIIHQSAFPAPETLKADLQLPAAAWGEADGSYAGMPEASRDLKFKAFMQPPGKTRTHNDIYAGIAGVMGKEIDFSFAATARPVPAKVNSHFARPEGSPGILSSDMTHSPAAVPPDDRYPFLLMWEINPHAYQGVTLSSLSEGMAMLVPENTLIIHPREAERLELTKGQPVKVTGSDGSAGIYPIELRRNVPPGCAYLVASKAGPPFEKNPSPVRIEIAAAEKETGNERVTPRGPPRRQYV